MKKLQEYFLYFMFYSIIGWCYEVFLEVVVYRWGFSNRGVLFGPYCVIYGFGALILIFSLSWLMFQGRVALNPSIRFGIGGMIFLYILQPLFEKGVRKMPERAIQVVSAILAILLCADVIYLFLK